MKRFAFLLLALAGIAGCNAVTPEQQAAFVKSLDDTKTALQQTATALHEQAATTADAKTAKQLNDAAKAVETKAIPAVDTAHAVATAPNIPAAVIQVAAPLIPEPYRAGLELGLALLAIWKAQGKKKSDDAATSMQSGISAAIGNGSIVVKPNAAATVDSHITDHPITSQLIDSLNAAPKG